MFLRLLLQVFLSFAFFVLSPLCAQNISEAIKLDKQGFSLWDEGKFQEAVPLFERSLAICERSLGPQHPDTADSVNNLGSAYKNIGEYGKALLLYNRALLIWEKSCGPSSSSTAAALINLGSLYDDTGDYDKALQNYERALAISEKSNGSNHPVTADILNDLGLFYGNMGNQDKALQLYERALAIRQKSLGPEHPQTARLYHNMGLVYYNMDKNEKAIQLYEHALSILEKSFGSQTFATVNTITNLGISYGEMCDFPNALLYSQRALAINEKHLGSQHPNTIGSLSTLGSIYFKMGDYAKAMQLYEKALASFEKSLGSVHPFTNVVRNALANLSYKMGNLLAARNYATRMATVESINLQTILNLDEKTRLSWQEKTLSYWTACILEPNALAEIALQTKGAILESLAEDRAMALAAGSSGEGAKILSKTKDLQAKLAKIAFEQGKKEDASKLQDEIGSLQRELTSKYIGRERKRASASMTMAEIMSALSGGGVLIDFIQFNDPKLKDNEATCLGAIITGEDNKSVFVRIDGGTAINRSIDSLRAAINQGNGGEVEAQTKLLSEKLWAPIATKIPEGTKRLFLCPDANLNFLSFAALLESDGRFVAEKYPITYIGSARDLAKKPLSEISKSIALIANPQFDATAKNAKTTDFLAMRSAEADVFGSIALPPLPGTEAEAASLQALASENGWQTKSYLGSDATETSVRNTKKPGVLHLATHGFYLNSFTPPDPEGSRGMSVVGVKETTEEKKTKEKGVDPMRASGVAFTGAQQTLTSWSQRKAPNPETDGVLTAEEVGALRLDGTWMVVLSACETGVGEARSGEGVFGLRRAFMIAGAENLLMTLWPVADETTAKIMTDFYKEAFATGDASGSLAKVQRDWLVKLRQERGLLAAIREAGPFAMVTMTNPNAQREFVEGLIEVTPEKAAMPISDKILEFEVALAKANAGDAYAQAIVSIYYGLGLGCDQDLAKSKEYVMLSAKQQNPLGIYRLAEMRETGEGMDQNTDQATQLMQKAKPGLQKLSSDPYALTALATIYERENPASPKVRDLLTKASDMGYEPAQTKLTQLPTNP